MHVLIIGAGGMIGKKLAAAIGRSAELGGKVVERMTVVDIAAIDLPETRVGTVDELVLDFSSADAVQRMAALRADVIFHLAAVVSGEAEKDFDKGYRINLDGTRNLFEAIRHEHDKDGYCPRLVFSSSIAVYGAPLPDPIPDDHIIAPRSSYGVQKAISELLLDDYTRRGFFEGIGIRLPTVVIRPGRPNAAASGFFSNILREPLAGKRAVLPVDDGVKHWLVSPRSAVGFLLHAATLDSDAVGPRRTMNMPGMAVTVADEIAALGRAAGPEAVSLIDSVPDPAIEGIIGNWPKAFNPARAVALGFTAETKVDELIAAYLEDDTAAAG